MPKISVVTGTYNRFDYLRRMMASVLVNVPRGIEVEFVIVDGGSTDGTLEWLRTLSHVTLIEHGALLGPQRAFCDGAKTATGEYVILANDDIEFMSGAIVRALVHIENARDCGAVAFADNRDGRGGRATDFSVKQMWVRQKGRTGFSHYAQVGMYPREIGNAAGWWGADDPAFQGATYGVDNYLSAKILEMGYAIDPVAGANVYDHIARDTLRERMEQGDKQQFYALYPTGKEPEVPNTKKQREGKRHLRILYLPIYEPGHAIQKTQKKGLREALMTYGRGQWVYEYDYLAGNFEELRGVVKDFQPDMVLTQLQSSHYTSDQVRELRVACQNAVWVNWNGDVAEGGLLSGEMIALLKNYDLQLCINGKALESYAVYGIPAAYWQIGYEEPGDELPDMPGHDVVFLGNAYDPRRQALERFLREHLPDVDFGFYGSGWQQSSGNTLYDFASGKALYRNAKMALGDNLYPDAEGFVSNRMFQAMAAGGCVYLQQEIIGLDERVKMQHGKHYLTWTDFADLAEKIQYYLDHEKERKAIATAGTKHVRKWHSFEARVKELFTELLHHARRTPVVNAMVKYTGPMGETGVRVGGYQYHFRHDTVTFVMPEHVYAFQNKPNFEFVQQQEP